MTPNDPKLKLAIAKMLPDILELSDNEISAVWWIGTTDLVRETEWLYIVSLVEEGLFPAEANEYALALRLVLYDYWKQNGKTVDEFSELSWAFAHSVATFNQRATAMCEVKGVEI